LHHRPDIHPALAGDVQLSEEVELKLPHFPIRKDQKVSAAARWIEEA
jgi:hypothetical protein